MIEKAPRILGVTPTPLATALQEGLTWHRAQLRRTIDYTFKDRLLAAV